MIRAIVFDFDGLILETETPAYESWAQIYREHGHELPLDRWLDYIGREGSWFDAYAELESLTGKPVDRDAVKARRSAKRDELIVAQEMLHGVIDLFRDAKERGFKVGIASSSGRDWVCGHLERLAFMEGWDAIVCRGDVERAKPAPDLYLRVTALLGAAPSETLALEDSPNGIAAAKAAGLWCVAVPNPLTRDLDLSQADIRLGSLADMPLEKLLARLEERAT